VISWTLDGRPIRLSDWEATTAVNAGYDTARGRSPRGDVVHAVQGSILTAYRTDASVMWQGRLAQPPTIRRGVAQLEAGGFHRKLRKTSRPMLYRFDDISAWVPGDGDPHEYLSSEKYEQSIYPGRMVLTIDKDEAYVAGNKNRAVLWLEDNRISKVEYDWSISSSASNFDLLLERGDGPDGTLTTEHTQSLSPTTSGTRTVSLTGNNDLVCLNLECNTNTTPTTKRKVIITGIRVYGRSTSDNVTASDVASDIADMAGLEDNVTGTETRILPLFFEAGSHADRLDFLAAFEDFRWLVLENRGDGPRLDYGPYSRVWRVTEERGAVYDLIDQERFNEVRVFFRAPSGRSRTVTAEADAGISYTNTYEFEWELPQNSSGIATAVATRVVNRLSQRRVAGSVEVREVTDTNGAYRAGHDVLAGDLLDLTDQADLPPQRIVRVTYREDGVRIDLENDVDLTALLRGKQRRRLVRNSL
jgi:hypothetical protein